jgi:hypothetical protein
VRVALAAALACLGAAPAAIAAAKPEPAQALTSAEEQALRLASTRGVLLYAYDQAAWHGTDAMVEKLPDARSKVGGWIVDGPAEAPEAVFFDRDKAAPRAVFVASFRNGELVSTRIAGRGEPELSPERKRLVAARAAALEALAAKAFQRCTEAKMNTVVLPSSAPGEPIYVYLLTPQTDESVIPFGGHYRIAVTPEGSVGEIRPFTNSCIAMRRDGDWKATPSALVISHLLDPVPTEIHVFSSLAARLPLYVATVKNGRVWAIERGRIRLVKDKD